MQPALPTLSRPRGGRPSNHSLALRLLLAGLVPIAALPARGQETPRVSLAEGLTIVTAVSEPEGDYESIKRIVAVTPEAVTLDYSADVPAKDGEGGLGALLGGLLGEPASDEGPDAGEVRRVRSRRTILRQDLAEAREYMQHFGEGLPVTIPGTTALGVSRAVLSDLRTNGSSPLTMRNAGPFGSIGSGIASLIEGAAGELAGVVDTSELEAIDKISGTLERDRGVAEPFPVLVDGEPTELPALRVHGTLGGEPVRLVLLDDPDNPLALAWEIGDLGSLQVVQIHRPAGTSQGEPQAIEQQLTDAGRAMVYGIYFDFGSDEIKPESRPVLDEIGAALRAHPDWRLEIEGHTDSIGDEQFNLRLSERRAAAVKAALVETYGVAAGRLAVAGFGETRPQASNDTLEGRARNRRVELVRQAPGRSG